MATPEMEQLEREIREMEEERIRELQEMEEERTRRAEVFAKNDADWKERKQISDENWAALQASSDELLQILDGEIEVDFSDERTSLQARIVELEEKLETALSDVTKAQADPAALEPKLRRANLAVAAGRQTQIQLRFLRRWILDILRRV